MAGSYLHLWMAYRAADTEPSVAAGGTALAALLAGSVAPDLGLFPGGCRRLTNLAHAPAGAGFARQLLAASEGAAHRAFAAGWALHLALDLAVHPWVEQRAAALRSQRANQSGPGPSRREGQRAAPHRWAGDARAHQLAHMRVEWGCDCRLLGTAEGRRLWRAPLEFPRGQGGGDWLSAEAARCFGPQAASSVVQLGERSLRRWLRLLPLLLSVCGKVPPSGRDWAGPVRRLVDRGTAVVVGSLARRRGWLAAAALAAPWKPSHLEMEALHGLSGQALSAFAREWRRGSGGGPSAQSGADAGPGDQGQTPYDDR